MNENRFEIDEYGSITDTKYDLELSVKELVELINEYDCILASTIKGW